jgi:hypothetical protein
LDGAAFLIARPFTGAAEATPEVDTTLAAINAAAVSFRVEKSMMSPYRYVQIGADQNQVIVTYIRKLRTYPEILRQASQSVKGHRF